MGASSLHFVHTCTISTACTQAVNLKEIGTTYWVWRIPAKTRRCPDSLAHGGWRRWHTWSSCSALTAESPQLSVATSPPGSRACAESETKQLCIKTCKRSTISFTGQHHYNAIFLGVFLLSFFFLYDEAVINKHCQAHLNVKVYTNTKAYIRKCRATL